MRQPFIFAFFALFLILSTSIYAAEDDYWRLAELKDLKVGTKGYGLSVFSGSEPERFEAEILGTTYAGFDFFIVIAKVHGAGFDSSGNTIAGTSGSPIYVDGKLVGALAYGWEFQKVPIAGIVPFEYMKKEEEARWKKSRRIPSAIDVTYEGRVVNLPLISLSSPPKGQNFADTLSQDTAHGASLGYGAFSWAEFEHEGRSAADSIGRLKPGSALSVALVEGDTNYFATGTVTAREGDTIYAFGHPILEDGKVEYPAWRASIVTVMPGIDISFKMDSGERHGERATIEYDGVFGIYGTVGKEPEMIPVTLSFSREGDTRKLEGKVVYGKHIPDLLEFLSFEFLKHYSGSMESVTLRVEGHIKTRGLPEVRIENLYTASPYGEKLPVVAQFLLTSQYFDALYALLRENDSLRFEALQLDFSVLAPKENLFVIEDVFLSTNMVKPGEKLLLSVAIAERSALGSAEKRKRQIALLSIEIPKDTPSGIVMVFVESADYFVDRRREPNYFPTTMEGLVENLNRTAIRNDQLYVSVVFPSKEPPKGEGARATKSEPKETKLMMLPGARGQVVPEWKEIAESPEVIRKERTTVAVMELLLPSNLVGVIEAKERIGFEIFVEPPRRFFN